MSKLQASRIRDPVASHREEIGPTGVGRSIESKQVPHLMALTLRDLHAGRSAGSMSDVTHVSS
ncbi:MAG: hypothetical protein J4N99_01125, partial [Chloroflexi bacterium]|nr:hypothetical protein [Chloroflexota bacterium]